MLHSIEGKVLFYKPSKYQVLLTWSSFQLGLRPCDNHKHINSSTKYTHFSNNLYKAFESAYSLAMRPCHSVPGHSSKITAMTVRPPEGRTVFAFRAKVWLTSMQKLCKS